MPSPETCTQGRNARGEHRGLAEPARTALNTARTLAHHRPGLAGRGPPHPVHGGHWPEAERVPWVPRRVRQSFPPRGILPGAIWELLAARSPCVPGDTCAPEWRWEGELEGRVLLGSKVKSLPQTAPWSLLGCPEWKGPAGWS